MAMRDQRHGPYEAEHVEEVVEYSHKNGICVEFDEFIGSINQQ